MKQHTDQQQCLQALLQCPTDGGAQEYVQQSRGAWDVRESPTGACAVATLVHARLQPPTGQAFDEAMFDLQDQQGYHEFSQRKDGENFIRFRLRRAKQVFVTLTLNPAHETSTRALASILLSMGYQVIYPNDDNDWRCICDHSCLYVLDVMLPQGGHAMTVHDGTAYTTAPFDPTNTRVVHVYRLPPADTQQLVASRQREEAWHDNMEQNTCN